MVVLVEFILFLSDSEVVVKELITLNDVMQLSLKFAIAADLFGRSMMR